MFVFATECADAGVIWKDPLQDGFVVDIHLLETKDMSCSTRSHDTSNVICRIVPDLSFTRRGKGEFGRDRDGPPSSMFPIRLLN